MVLSLRILYRGSLSSCNYDCSYCPFAKRHETAAELRKDREELDRFCEWVAVQSDCSLSILFTPWGEALVRRWYQQALVRLSHLPSVAKVAVQTNLSCPLDWLAAADRSKTALWCTYHPSQTSRGAFLGQCRELVERGIPFSVGMVGLHESLDEIEAMRRELPQDVYLWINAYKDVSDYYSLEQVARLVRVDPLFRINNLRHASLDQPCAAGETAVSVDGKGDLRRCHFVSRLVGNIYSADWKSALARRPCPNVSCGCYIGYMLLPKLQHERIFGAGLLERIPQEALWADGHSSQALQLVNTLLDQ